MYLQGEVGPDCQVYLSLMSSPLFPPLSPAWYVNPHKGLSSSQQEKGLLEFILLLRELCCYLGIKYE